MLDFRTDISRNILLVLFDCYILLDLQILNDIEELSSLKNFILEKIYILNIDANYGNEHMKKNIFSNEQSLISFNHSKHFGIVFSVYI